MNIDKKTNQHGGATLSMFLLPVLTLFLPALLLASDDDVSIGDRPEWVVVENWDASMQTPTLGTGNESVVYLLTDRQHRPQTNTKYTKRVYRVTNDAGVQQKLKVTVDFDPSYSKLILHDVSIRRGDKTIDKCDISKMKIFQPEDDLSRDIYSEDKRVLIFLDDLRIDDTIVVEYSVIGTNPALLGLYSYRLPIQYSIPVERGSYRLVWDAKTPVTFQARNSDIQPAVTRHDNRVEYAWSIPPQPASKYEDRQPYDFNDRPYLEVSNSSDWTAVVDWGLETYKTLDDPLDSDTLKIIDLWKQESSEPEELASKALRFVQDKIRYVGLEMGPGSLRPAAPTNTMDCRFGDCKAKAILLCAMLRHMDIDAAPALVNSYRGKDIGNSLPTPLAFDHVIVRAKFSGKTIWVDPTDRQQGGAFSQTYIPVYYGKALAIAKGVQQLETVRCPSEAMNDKHTNLTFDVDDYEGTATMKVTTHFHGHAADSMRRYLVGKNYETISEDYLNFYAEDYPGIREPTPLEITDDREQNILLIKEQYLVDNLFVRDKEDEPLYIALYPYGMTRSLPSPETRIRKTPLAINYPVRRTYKTVLNTPDAFDYENYSEEVEDPAFKFSTHERFNGTSAEFEHSLETLQDRVPPDEITQYLANYDKVVDLLPSYPEVAVPLDKSANWFAIMASLFTMLLTGGVVYWAASGKKAGDSQAAEYDSIGGWLILIGVGVVLGVFTTLYGFLIDWEVYYTWSQWTDLEFGIALAFEIICKSAFAILSVALAISFFTKRKIFPKLYIFICVSSILFVIGDIALCQTLLEIPPEPKDFSELGKMFLRAAIWIPYMLLSKRVKGTFVR